MSGLLDMENELLTTKEAAKYLRLSEKSGHLTIGRWVRQGLLRAGRAGDHYVFRKEDLNKFIFKK